MKNQHSSGKEERGWRTYSTYKPCKMNHFVWNKMINKKREYPDMGANIKKAFTPTHPSIHPSTQDYTFFTTHWPIFLPPFPPIISSIHLYLLKAKSFPQPISSDNFFSQFSFIQPFSIFKLTKFWYFFTKLTPIKFVF